MIGIHIDKVLAAQKIFKDEIEEQRLSALDQLKQIDKNLFDDNEKKYLKRVISLFSHSGFLTKSPRKLIWIKKNLGIIPDNSRPKKLKPLKKYIQEALNYKVLRSLFYPKYFDKIGIKACVYCNSQLTVTIKKIDNTYSARFDVDHYYSKDDYPFLCISLFNLYPACASCNRVKSTKAVSFNLYTNVPSQIKKSGFTFILDHSSKARYLTTKNGGDIIFKFNEPPVAHGINTFKDAFYIEQLYQTQKDLVEELIVKSQIYNNAHREQLRKSFTKLSLSEKLFERIIVGNYTDEKDIHKRPMSKIMMDIARDLKIIK